MHEYDAFISYRQGDDTELAAALQTGLQRLAKPWNRRRALEVFRDSTGMSANPDVAGALKGNLGQSRFLVLLASPGSAASPWVDAEIKSFLARDADAWKQIVVVLTEGEWKWAGNGTYTADSTAVPPALVGVFPTEILYVDLRWARGRDDLTLGLPAFKAAVADVAAPIHDKTEDELIGEDVRQFRLAKRLRWSAVAGLSLLLVASLIASAVAVSNGREAVRQRNVAVESAAVARAGELAAKALAVKDDDPAVAALLAVESLYPNDVTEAMELPQSVNAVGVTSRALMSRVLVSSGSLPASEGQAIVTTVGDFVATVDASGCWPAYKNGLGVQSPLTWWNRNTRERLDGVPPGVTLDRSFVNTEWGVLRIDDQNTVTPMVGGYCFLDGTSPRFNRPATYDPIGDVIVAHDQQARQLVVLDPTTLEPELQLDPLDDPSLYWVDVVTAEFTAPDGAVLNIVAASVSDGAFLVWVPPFTTPLPAFTLANARVSTLATTGRMLFGGDGVADLTSAIGGALLTYPLPGVFDYSTFALFSENERYLALIDGCCRAGVWDVSVEPPQRVAYVSSSTVSAMQWVGDELALTSGRGVEFYEVDEPRIDRGVWALSADGSTAVVGSYDSNELEIRSVGDPTAAPIRTVERDAADYPSVGLSADGTLLSLASASLPSDVIGAPEPEGPALVRIIDVATGAEVFRREGSVQPSVAFDPSGRYVVYTESGSAALPTQGLFSSGPALSQVDELESPVEVYETDGWTLVARGQLPDVVAATLRWSPKGELIGSTDAGELQVVGFGEGTIVASTPLAGVLASSWWPSPDGQLLAAPDAVGRVSIWTGLASGAAPRQLATLDAGTVQINQIVFSPDTQRMVTVVDTSITMWDISTPESPVRVERLDGLPLLAYAGADTSLGGSVQFRDGGRSLLIQIAESLVTLPDFDPAGVCAVATEADLERAEEILGHESACTRIPALQPAS